MFDCLFQNDSNRTQQPLGVLLSEPATRSLRMYAGEKQGFVGVDVAQTCHESLVKQQDLDGGLSSSEPGTHLRYRRRGGPCVGPQPPQAGIDNLVLVEHRHVTEGSRIDKAHLGSVLQQSGEVGVGGNLIPIGGLMQPEPARHAQMGHQGEPVVERHHQELAAPPHREDLPLGEPIDNLISRSVVTCGTVVGNRGLADRPSLNGRFEMSPGGFDFWQLGQPSLRLRSRYRNQVMSIEPRPMIEVIGDATNALARTWKPLFVTSLWAFVPAGIAGVLIFRASGATDILGQMLDNPGAFREIPQEIRIELAESLLGSLGMSALVQGTATLFVFLAAHKIVALDTAGFVASSREARLTAVGRFLSGMIAALFFMVMVGGLLYLAIVVAGLSAALGGVNSTAAFFSALLGLALLGPALWLGVRLSMWSSALIIERIGPMTALRSSFILVRDRWWPTFGFLILVSTLSLVAVQLIQTLALPLWWVAELGSGAWLGTMIAILAQGPIVASVALMYTTWYIDLRSRSEVINPEELV